MNKVISWPFPQLRFPFKTFNILEPHILCIFFTTLIQDILSICWLFILFSFFVVNYFLIFQLNWKQSTISLDIQT